MPAIKINTSRLKEVLHALPELPPHNWLVTELDCLDYCGWEGCEKWAKTELFLTDEELMRDVDFRNMQIIWGVFSAIPATYTKAEIDAYEPPTVDSPRYMSEHIVPQHPLAILEISVRDGWYLLVSSENEKLLEPLYQLPFPVEDEEESNRKLNVDLREIQNKIRALYPDIDQMSVQEIQWICWHALYRERKASVKEEALEQKIRACYQQAQVPGYRWRYARA